ncbi:MAG: GNAT family N-acetyltransferase [Lachnospiraceae bacterium]|nr:GNAT family N-acetyltransferase [Lachnospiraceae bacterium]
MGQTFQKDKIELRENQTTVSEYLNLRSQVHWKSLTIEQARLALDNSLYVLGAYYEGTLVGMGRVVGDGAVICYIQDLVVSPSMQHMGLGSILLQKLKEYVNFLRLPHSEMMLDLMCAKGREAFYEKHGFLARPTETLGPGMIIYLNDETCQTK